MPTIIFNKCQQATTCLEFKELLSYLEDRKEVYQWVIMHHKNPWDCPGKGTKKVGHETVLGDQYH